MTRNGLLESLKDFVLSVTSGMQFPTAVQKGDTEIVTKEVEAFKMRLPKSSDAKKKVPYIIIQFVNGTDKQEEARTSISEAFIRMIFCVYNEDEEEGAIMLLNLMDTIRIPLLEQVVVGKSFQLDVHQGIESLAYTDDTAPYFAGEMFMKFYFPSIHRKVSYE